MSPASKAAAWPRTVGIVGAGAMGSAMGVGLARTGRPVAVYDAVAAVARAAQERDGLATGSLHDVAAADLVCVAVKPADGQAALQALRPQLSERSVVLSVMAGWTLDRLTEALPDTPLARTMPNLAVRHAAGLIAVATRALPDGREAELLDALDALGTSVALPEGAFSVATALVGSGPGFVALIAEALEEGAVSAGLPRAQARQMVPAVLAGTAALLGGGKDPAELRQRVSSPAGTTLAGLTVLERGAVRAHMADAVRAAAARAEEL
ncbi:MAG: pyrroline-5-carboxylate reductase [Thermoleophilia bacterium]|nr:pyrroline-5-carboxylate reductase [Thermoleophilia bacterium]MDH3724139.1 pyrroline-5-carboxylate reductase [Thermoleophilia bacterium]